MKLKPLTDLTQSELKRRLHYDPDTGIFTWKPRPEKDFKTKSAYALYCKRYEGKTAWSKDTYGYFRIHISGKTFKAHRLAWLYVYGQFPDGEIDHINQVKDDNRICNLRDVTMADQNRNHGMHPANKSGITGVCYFHGAWSVSIGVKCLKRTKDFFEACCVRRSAERRLDYPTNHGKVA